MYCTYYTQCCRYYSSFQGSRAICLSHVAAGKMTGVFAGLVVPTPDWAMPVSFRSGTYKYNFDKHFTEKQQAGASSSLKNNVCV